MSHSDNLKFKIWSDSLYRVQNICPKQAECLMLVYISKRDSLRESLPADFFLTPNHSCLQLFQQPPPHTNPHLLITISLVLAKC